MTRTREVRLIRDPAPRTGSLSDYSYKLHDGGYGLDVAFGEDVEADPKTMSVWVPFADGNSRDGVGDLLEVAGIDTSRHRKNPIVLLDHGKAVKLPVAKAEDPDTGAYTVFIDPVAKTARAKAFFYRGADSEHALLCEQVFDLIYQKFLRGGSIGYHTVEADHLPPYNFDRDGNPIGQHLKRILMLEASVVVLPCNADTVRKCLAMPKVCGKPMSPYLVKSLQPYAGSSTATVSVPRDVRKGPKVPPARWKPGVGAVKDGVPGGLAEGKDPSEFDPEKLAEGVKVEMEHTSDPAIAREIAMDHLTEDPDYYRKLRKVEGKDLDGPEVKGSYFENCPRDDTGHCKPRGTDNMSGGGKPPDKDKKRKPKPEEDKFRRDKDKQGALGEPDQAGPFRVVVKDGTRWFVIHTRDDEWPPDGPYGKRGEAQKVADQLNQQYLTGANTDPSAVVGGEADDTMATDANDAEADEFIDPAPGSPGTGQEQDQFPDDQNPDPDADPGGDVVTDPATEKYGAQCLRQIHSDFAILMEDYDEMVQMLEQQEVKDSVVKILVHMGDSIAQLEQLFFSVYPEIADQLGAGATSPGLAEDDELGGDDNQDADTMDDPAVASDSDEPDVPSPEEAAEGMRRNNNKSLDDLRAKYKSATLCPSCGRADCPCAGKKGCKCSYKGAKAGDDSAKETKAEDPEGDAPDMTPEDDKEGGADPWGDFADHEKSYVKEGHGFLGELAVAKEFMDEHRMKSYHYHKVFEAIGGFDPMAEAGETVGAAVEANRDNIVSGMGGDPDSGDEGEEKGLPDDPAGGKDCGMKLPHLRKACKEISDHLKGLAFSRDPYGDDHRAKATHYYKMLESLMGNGDDAAVQSPAYEPEGPTGETSNPKPEEETLEDPEAVKSLRDVLSKQIERQEALSKKLASLLG